MRYQHTSQKSEKKNWNHTKPLESNRTISNKTTTFEISQSPKLDKIIQTPLNAAQLLWIIRKLPLFSATSPVLLQSSDLLTNFQELSTTSSSLWANAPWVIGELSWIIGELLRVLSEVIRVSELHWVVEISRNSTDSLVKSLKLSANLPWVAGERKLVRTSCGWTLREMSSKPLMADNMSAYFWVSSLVNSSIFSVSSFYMSMNYFQLSVNFPVLSAHSFEFSANSS